MDTIRKSNTPKLGANDGLDAEGRPVSKKSEGTPNRVRLKFSSKSLQTKVPKELRLSKSAQYTISQAIARVQREIISSVNGPETQQLPDSPGTFVARSPSGYRVFFSHHGDKTEIVDIITPSQVEQFKSGSR